MRALGNERLEQCEFVPGVFPAVRGLWFSGSSRRSLWGLVQPPTPCGGRGVRRARAVPSLRPATAQQGASPLSESLRWSHFFS